MKLLKHATKNAKRIILNTNSTCSVIVMNDIELDIKQKIFIDSELQVHAKLNIYSLLSLLNLMIIDILRFEIQITIMNSH